MVALTAIGMIWTTAAHAAPLDGNPTSVYGNNNPQLPGTPTVPGYSGPGLDTRGDVEVTFLTVKDKDGTVTWTFRVKNISVYPAKNVKVGSQIDWAWPGFVNQVGEVHWYDLHDIAPGASETYTVTCVPKPNRPPCYWGFLAAYMGDNLEFDHNPHNNAANHGINP
jgi:hypothetical protein